MPTYEYRCKDCGYVYDVFHKISQSPLKKCPKCSKETLQRSIGGGDAILNFKGDGFYITDYAQKKDKKGDSSG